MQRKPLKVVHYRYAFDKYGSGPEPKHIEAINKLFNGEFHSVRNHSIHYSTPFRVDSISYGGKPRMLHTYKETEAARYFVITEDLSQHEYQDSDTERSKRLADCIADFQASLERGEFIPIKLSLDEEQEATERKVDNFYYYDGKYIEFTTAQMEIVAAPLPQYNFGAAGAGKTLTDMAILENAYQQRHSVLYVTQRPELANKERDIRDAKHVLSDAEDSADFAVLDYVSLLKLVDPALDGKTHVGESYFNDWFNDYLSKHKRQSIPPSIINRKGEVYKELRNLSGYSESKYLEKSEQKYLSLGKRECLFLDTKEKEYLLKLYKEYSSQLKPKTVFDPSFHEIVDFSLFEDYVIALDEVDNFSTLQIMQLMRFAKFKDMVISGDSHQLIDDLLPKGPFIKRMLGDKCKANPLDSSMRSGKRIIEFGNALINVTYDVTGGKAEKDEYSQIKVPDSQHEGVFEWIGTGHDALRALQKKYGDVELVVITHSDFINEARERFPRNLVCTFDQSKGREFKHVAIYRPFDHKEFEGADKLLQGKASKQKHNLPKEHDRQNLSFAPIFNQVFVGCTRAIESLTICQVDRHEVKNILQRLRPNVAKSKVQVEVKDVKDIEKNDNPTARLERAIELLRDGDVKLALEEREKLGEAHKRDFDEYKSEMEMRRRLQAERERERHEKRRLKKEKDKGQDKVESKKTTVKPPVDNVSQSAVFKKPIQPAGKRCIAPDLTVATKEPVISNAKELLQVLSRQDAVDVLFAINKNGMCKLFEILQDPYMRQSLAKVAKGFPGLFVKIPLERFFQTYQSSILNNTVFGIMVTHQELNDVTKALLSNLSQDNLAYLVDMLFRVELAKDGGGADFSIFFYLLAENRQIMLYLIERYGERFGRLLTAQRMSSALRIDNENYSYLDILASDEPGCNLLVEFIKLTPDFLSELTPEAMFRLHRPYASTGKYIAATIFGNILTWVPSAVSVLNDWLSYDTWIPYVINYYKQNSSQKLVEFMYNVLGGMVYCWREHLDPPMRRLVHAQPDFIMNLLKRGLYYNDPLGVTCSIFSIIATDVRLHSHLKEIYELDVSLYEQLSFDELYAPHLARNVVNLAPAIVMLVMSEDGLQLLRNILNARKDVLEKLATLDELTCIYQMNPLSNTGCTTFYDELVKSETGISIIELLFRANPELSHANIQADINQRKAAYLSQDEKDLVDFVVENYSKNNLYNLLKRDNAQRLMFRMPMVTNGISFYDFVTQENARLQIFTNIILGYPNLIKNVFPVNFFNMGKMQTNQSQVSFLKLTLHHPAGMAIIRALFLYPEYRAYFHFEYLFTEAGFNAPYPLFDDIIKNKDLHFLLKPLIGNSVLIDIVHRYAEMKLSDGPAFTVICRYYPELIVDLCNQLKHKLSHEFSAEQVLFRHQGVIVNNFYWLSKCTAAHEFLLSAVSDNGSLLNKTPAFVFALSLKASPESREQFCILSLLETEAGRNIIHMYLSDSARAANLANPTILSKQLAGKDILTGLATKWPELAVRLININPKLIDSLTLDAYAAVKSHFPNGSNLFASIQKHAAILSLQATKAYKSLLKDFTQKQIKEVAEVAKNMARSAEAVSVNVLDRGRENEVLKIIKSLGSAAGLFELDDKNECIFVASYNYTNFLNDLAYAFKSNPELFQDIPVAALFHPYNDPGDTKRKVCVLKIMLRYDQLDELLVYILSNLDQAGQDLLIKEFHLERRSKDNVSTFANEVANVYPNLLMVLQGKYPAFSKSFTAGRLFTRFPGSEKNLSIFESLSQSSDGCEFFNNLVQMNSDLLTRITPETMFRIFSVDSEDGLMFQSPFSNFTLVHVDNDNMLFDWLDKADWMDYLTNLYSVGGKALSRFTEINLHLLFSFPCHETSRPALRLLRAHPDFISKLAQTSMFDFYEDKESLFELLCSLTVYHEHLYNCHAWDKFPKLDTGRFLRGSVASIPFSLSRSTYGLRFLHTILMLRPDLRKETATIDTLFSVVAPKDPKSEALHTCLYLNLNNSKEGLKILDLLRETNPALTQKLLSQSLARSGLDFLTQDECAIVDKVRQNVTVESLANFLMRPDASRLFTCSSGMKDHFSLFIDLLCDDADLLCRLFEQYPELVKVMPADFLLRNILLSEGVRGKCLDVIMHKNQVGRFLRLFESHDEYFEEISFDLLFKCGEKETGKKYFELALLNESMHWLLLKMLGSYEVAKLFDAIFGRIRLSEADAFTMACKYCPELALKLIRLTSKSSKDLAGNANSFFVVTTTLTDSQFHWLARYSQAHEWLYLLYRNSEASLVKITADTFTMSIPSPFASAPDILPLVALAQTAHGRAILRSYINNASQNNLKFLARPEYVCQKIVSINPLINGKDLLGILASSVDVDGYDCTGLAVKLIECCPELIDHASLLTLALLQGSPQLKPKTHTLIEKRLSHEADRLLSEGMAKDQAAASNRSPKR